MLLKMLGTMTGILIKLITMLLLAGEALRDLRTGMIAMTPVAAAAFSGTLIRACSGAGPGELLASLMPGLCMLAVSKVTNEAAGYGDGWIIIGAGLLNGLYVTLVTVFTGLLSMFTVSVFIKTGGDMEKDVRIPFVPFLAAAYGAVMLL